MVGGVDTRTDKGELREVLIAFMDKYRGQHAAPGTLRLHKFVFFGDIYSLHWYGGRLTDADFKAYDYGAFSEDIEELLIDLGESGEIEITSSPSDRGQQYHNNRPPKLSRGKKEIITEIWQELKSLSDPDLGQFSKGTWLYENTPYNESMDWEAYQKKTGTATHWREVVEGMQEKNPVEDPEDSVADILD